MTHPVDSTYYTPPPNSTNAPAPIACSGNACACCGRCNICGQRTYNGVCQTLTYVSGAANNAAAHVPVARWSLP